MPLYEVRVNCPMSINIRVWADDAEAATNKAMDEVSTPQYEGWEEDGEITADEPVRIAEDGEENGE